MNEEGIARFFDCCETPAQRRLTRRMSSKARKHLVNAVMAGGLSGRSVLEIGCGRGELLLDLLREGAERATGVDLAETAIQEAERNASEQGLSERAEFRTGNGAEETLPGHDIVILDKVICCYPDWKRLVTNASSASSQTFAFVIPRSDGPVAWLIKAFAGLGNLAQRVKGCSYRAFIHDLRAIHAHLASSGFARLNVYRGPVWTTSVYVRS